MKERFSIEVSGIVHGVGFRWYTQQVADQLDIAGWVKNQRNGKVMIEAEGEIDSLKDFIKRIQKGPISSSVDHIKTKKINTRNQSVFQIQY